VTDNGWQFGVYGNNEDVDDEVVRQCILSVKQQYNCSASEAIKRICIAYKTHMETPAPIQEQTAYAEPYAQTITADYTELIQAIHELGDRLENKLDNIKVTHIPPRQELPPTMDETPTTWEDIDPNADTPFIRGARKMGARPGMRLQD